MRYRNLSLRDAGWVLVCVAALVALIGITLGAGRAKADDAEDVSALIDQFQDAYSNERLTELRQLFVAEAVVATDGSQGTRQSVCSIDEWLENTKEYVFDENEHLSDVLSNREIHVFRNMAYAVCDYVYTSDTEIGRGVDVLTFLKIRDHWRIVSLQFTGDETPKE